MNDTVEHAQQFLLVSALVLASTTAALVIVNAEGHPCCQTPPCWPLTIIKECGEPSPAMHSYDEAMIAISIMAAALVGSFFAVRRHFKKKDFYLVR